MILNHHIPKDHVYSTAEAAKMVGVSPRRIRALAKDRGHGYMLLGRLYFTADEIDNMRNRRAGPGRPPTKKVDE